VTKRRWRVDRAGQRRRSQPWSSPPHPAFLSHARTRVQHHRRHFTGSTTSSRSVPSIPNLSIFLYFRDSDVSHCASANLTMDSNTTPPSLPAIPSSSLETLYSEFSRRHPPERQSWTGSTHMRDVSDLNRQLVRKIRRLPQSEPGLDLRALDYVAEYEPHLMCPICHVPLIDPISLECDHCFCTKCFVQSCDRVSGDEGPKCPTCRATTTTAPRKASRLIVNMCDDLKVRCPNEGCGKILARGHIEYHATKQCDEQRLTCPAFPTCNKLTKRKNFVAEQCKHDSHIDCGCGKVFEIGKDDWLRHRDEECPEAGIKCEACHKRMPDDTYLPGTVHECEECQRTCPGEEFGCGGCGEDEDMVGHIRQCTIARLAPSLKAQASLLAEIKSELAWTKSRNEVLENALDQLNELGRNERQPVPTVRRPGRPSTAEFSLPSLGFEDSQQWQQELSGPWNELQLPTNPEQHEAVDTTSQQHLLALHESLRTNFANLQVDVRDLSGNLADVDARISMHIMNETLRIKEDLAHTNAALFATRSQLQWLLNRERAGQQMGIRGRAPPPAAASSSSQATVASAAPMMRRPSSDGSGSEQTAESVLANRPARRPSGSSQERVKL
jgi:hypothetical protein